MQTTLPVIICTQYVLIRVYYYGRVPAKNYLPTVMSHFNFQYSVININGGEFYANYRKINELFKSYSDMCERQIGYI